MDRYKRKPAYVEAVQVTDAMFDALPPDVLRDDSQNPDFPVVYDPEMRAVHVKGAIATVGYWIVREADGWLTVWGDALFKATYMRAK